MKPRFNRPAYPTTRLSATARHAYIAQVARISVQYWAPIQLELSSMYCKTSGTASATKKKGIITRGLVSVLFQPAGPDSQKRLSWSVDSAGTGCGVGLMHDPPTADRRGAADG